MKKAKRILVGLKNHEEAVPLTDFACRVGAHGAWLFLVHVIELPDITPLDADVPVLEAEAEKTIRAARRLAKRSGMNVSAQIVRAHSAGQALLAELKENRIDLLVLGSHRRKTLGEVLLGTTHDFLARRATCEVLLHIPAKEARAARASKAA